MLNFRSTVMCAFALAASGPLLQSARAGDENTVHDLLSATRAEHAKYLLQSYSADAPPAAVYEADARAFLGRVGAYFASRQVPAWYVPLPHPKPGPLLDEADKLIAAGCDVPVVVLCKALLMQDAARSTAALQLHTGNLPRLLAGGTTPNYKASAIAAYTQAAETSAGLDLDLRRRVAGDLPVHVAAFCSVPVDRPIELRRRLSLVMQWCRVDPVGQLGDVLGRIESDANVDRWLVESLRGQLEIKRAWKARGSGWSDTVIEQGWADFYKHLGLARDALTKAHVLRPDFPESATAMIVVAMGGGATLEESARTWFDTAVAAQADYRPAWEAMLNALRPRWGGSPAAMLALGMEAAGTGRYDTDTPYFLTQAVQAIATDHGQDFGVYDELAVWRALRGVHDGYLAAPMPGIDVAWLRSRKAALAYRCNYPAEVVNIADAVGDQWQDEAFDDLQLSAAECVLESRARIGASSRAIEAALAAERAGRPAEAVRTYDAISAEADPAGPTHRFAVGRAGVHRVRMALTAGGPVAVPLAAAADRAAWFEKGPAWTTDGDAISATPQNWQAADLQYRGNFDGPTVVSCEFLLHGNDPLLAVVFRDTGPQGRVSVVACGGVLRVNTYTTGFGVSKPVVRPDTWHSLRIEPRGDQVAVFLDGNEALVTAKNAWLSYGRPTLGLLARTRDAGDHVKVRNVTVTPAGPG
jgi:hypothetical protein